MKLTDATLKQLLTNMTGLAGVFDKVKCFVGVATALDDKGGLTTLADITQATGVMGTRLPITAWSAPYLLNDDRWAADGNQCAFVPLDATESQFLTHWFIADALTAGNLVAFGQLGSGVMLPDHNHHLTIIPRVCTDPAAGWGAEVTYNG